LSGIGEAARAAGEGLVRRGWTLALAESCTGGLVMQILTEIPGSSRYLLGGVVAYADRVKEGILGVDPGLLRSQGAVSEGAAREMAEGILRLTGATLGVAITGIAGPEGGTPEKPVGTVWIAIEGPEGGKARLHRVPGDRRAVREGAALSALRLLEEATR
jgi:PncC family amidohydrolase